MGGGYSANFKNCATCAYWNGARKLNGTRTQALYEYGTKGDCYAGSGSAPKRRSMTANNKCGDYEKWAQLKSTSSSRSNTKSSGSGGNIMGKLFYAAIIITGIIGALITFVKENKEVFITIGIVILILGIVFVIAYMHGKNKRKKMLEKQFVQTDNLNDNVSNLNNDDETEIQSSSIETEEKSTSFEEETQTNSFDSIKNCPETDSSTEYSQKKWLTTLLLLIFLGTLGIHRFYIGRIVTGIFMLIITIISLILGFGYIILIWCIIDLILLCTGKFKDVKGNVIKKA